ncbi:MAG TPA: hypothetical protein PLF40_05650, partial [Kofleriaceae bacterium]|nr:hypothetical protein [Kofleriaceae bacterium]
VYAASRASMVLLAAVSKPAGEGLGAHFCASLGRGSAVAAMVVGCGFALLADWQAAAILVVANAAAVVGLGLRWFVSAPPRQRFHKPPSTRAPAVQQGRAPCQVCQV